MSSIDEWGIEERFEDSFGELRITSDKTREAIRDTMGDQPAIGETDPIVIRSGRGKLLDTPAELTLEDGTSLGTVSELPADLPLGYHSLHRLDLPKPIRIIVSPKVCFLPDGYRSWGWAVQLYSVRSHRSWGMGDLADLRRLGRWSATDLGTGMIMINPLHAPTPTLPQQASPYYPSTRRFMNPLYLAVEDVPGARELLPSLETLAKAGKALNEDRLIDRDKVFGIKQSALEKIWDSWHEDSGFEDFLKKSGTALEHFAIHCTLAEMYGANWRDWPSEYRRPDSPQIPRFAAEHSRRVRYHQWLQWLIDLQLAAAAAEIPLLQDLPVGVDPGGFDAWDWQDVMALDVSVGAPPDRYNTQGQNWGLPPFIPGKLRAAGYEPFAQMIRASLKHAHGLRIDHALGLFRLFWIPQGFGPVEGAFVHYPADDLLAIIALESQRAQAVIVGEDLGSLAAGVHDALLAHRILSYRLLWFEDVPTEKYPDCSMAAVTTHDLPTIAGFWTGKDLEEQERLGMKPEPRSYELIHERLAKLAGVTREMSTQEVIRTLHAYLSRSPSALIAATLEDALEIEERPNMPGTRDGWPNWKLALPVFLEDFGNSELLRDMARILGRR
jgi:4-alpha-glucanotransferase